MIDIQILPELFFISSTMCLLLLGIVLHSRTINLLALSITIITFILLILTIDTHEIFILNSLLKLNCYIRYAQLLVLTTGILILLLLYLSKTHYKYEVSILILLSIFGMLNVIASNSFISFYLSFELMNLSLYILTAYNKDSQYSCEAGIKYFILSILSSCIMLYGISLIYGYTGKVNFSEISIFYTNNQISYGLLFGLLFIIIALCFKLAIAPFHIWVPDVYQGAPTIITAFFSTSPKVTLVTFLIRFLNEELISIGQNFQPIFLCCALLSVLLSSFGALHQRNMKRLLAYSSIGHVGFILASLSVFTQEGISSALIYLLIYVITTVGLFAFFIQIDDDDCNITHLSSMRIKSPVLAFHMSILFLSMSGLPPLAGFFAKLFVFNSLIQSGYFITSVILAISSIISCYYYLNIIKMIYFDHAVDEQINYSQTLIYVISLISLLNILCFIFLDKISWFINSLTIGLIK
ncbi:NADH-quinone oxidoreductase subunit N [Wolbachia endosymbiont of Howardula sp.]|uniref:NADH-quinone oxidoreductase subunit N n=1 Tax=Wolbachia endosymbiont of Howardula sp. TaxID=2916816 RepID=UPI00217EE6E9|nr:NADH-quinone oxidoreductase subunit N [Wolbachia endosymbiont of Howardula sp.]UWI83218.1 NADH-quinone oxidoreductase subunit N [Wolbachia endosymbiont of Howardula sp.]